MKKTLLGKVTFVLTCVCLCLFIAVKILDVWGFGRAIGGFENMMNVFSVAFRQGEGMAVLSYGCKTFILPIIWTWGGFLYIFAIKNNKPIKKSVCLYSAMTVFIDFILMVSTNNGFFLLPVVRCGFLIVLILLFLELKKAGYRKGIYITFGLTYIFTFICVIVYMMNAVSILSTDTGISLFYALITYMMLPAVFLVVAVLMLGYILFPEKYIGA